MNYARHIAACVASAGLSTLVAAQEVYPLSASAVVGAHVENVDPFLMPARCVQTKLVDRQTLMATQNLPASLVVWDMISIDATSRFLFVPCERFSEAGVFRYDTATGDATVLMRGNGGPRTADPSLWDPNNDDYARLDPSRLTAWGSLVTAEEQTGGRFFEIMNPFAAGGFQVEWRSKIPAVKHEGVAFDAAGAMYFVDESSSGSVYKFVPQTPGDLAIGQSFVLSVNAYAADPAAQPGQGWGSSQNQQTTRHGAATWVPITDPAGNPLTVADPFEFVTANGGRFAADEVMATPYGQLEDMAIGTLANGNECLYVAVAAEHAVLSIELVDATSSFVRYCVDRATIDLATGNAIGVDLSFPDSIALDAFGQVYIVEDHVPGDIFKVQDVDGDGIAESIGRITSMDVDGAEPSGLIFDPNDPYLCYCCVMHPTSGNDAIWAIQTRPYPGHGDSWLSLQSACQAGEPFRSGVAEFVDIALPSATVTLAIDPHPVLVGLPFVILAEPFLTAAGTPGVALPVWTNPLVSLPLHSGALAALPGTPPYGSAAISLPVPPGLQGISLVVQAVAHAPAFGLVWSDGVELMFQ